MLGHAFGKQLGGYSFGKQLDGLLFMIPLFIFSAKSQPLNFKSILYAKVLLLERNVVNGLQFS